jgi:hypothetical protein
LTLPYLIQNSNPLQPSIGITFILDESFLNFQRDKWQVSKTNINDNTSNQQFLNRYPLNLKHFL